MKRIYFSLMIGAVAFTSFGQRNAEPFKEMGTAPGTLLMERVQNWHSPNYSTRALTGWFNYAEELDQLMGNNSSGAFMLLFPDSLVITGQFSDGTTARPQFMHAATMLDPKNMLFSPLTLADPYSIDSLEIGYGYLRNTASSVVDTVRIKFIRHNNALIWALASGNVYQDFEYTQATNSPKASEVLSTHTVLLTESDSSSTLALLGLETLSSPNISPGQRVGISIEFVPGYSYALNDSIDWYNQFYLFSLEEGGAGTDPTYFGPIDANDVNGNMNVSYALPASVRYNQNANGWNGYYIPTWAWQSGYAYENHYISWLVNAPIFNVDELAMSSEVKLFPNPASDRLTVQYTLNGNALLTFTVIDMNGKVVAERQEKQAEGNHEFVMDVTGLPSGNYVLSINSGSATSNHKFLVK